MEADVVGVRSAVCRGGDRTAELERNWWPRRWPSCAPAGRLSPGRSACRLGPGPRFADHDGHPGAAHRLGHVGVDGPPATGILQRLELLAVSRGRGGSSDGQRAITPRTGLSRIASSAPMAPAASTASESLVTAQDSGISGRPANAGATTSTPSVRGADQPAERLGARQ